MRARLPAACLVCLHSWMSDPLFIYALQITAVVPVNELNHRISRSTRNEYIVNFLKSEAGNVQIILCHAQFS